MIKFDKQGSPGERFVGLRRFVLTCLILMFVQMPLMAQTTTVSGCITDMNGQPLIGATIYAKGTSIGATTDLTGKFELRRLSSDAVLVVSYIGYQTCEVALEGRTELNLQLEEAANTLDDVVVVGYGAVRKRDLTGSITSVDSKTIMERNPTDLFDALQGAAPGVQITTNSGAPGEGANIRIRGTSTFGSGTNPLYVVDEVPMDDISAINPNDIQSIEILKDAASAAIYGSRSANGVIIITTKKGVPGKPRVDVKYTRSWSKIAHRLPLTSPDEFRYFNRQRLRLTGNTSKYELIDSLKPFFNGDGNQYDQLFRTSAKDEVNLSVSGASEKMTYYLSGGFYNEDGIVVNSAYKRYTTRMNATYKASKRLTIGNNFQFTYSDQSGINESDVIGNIYNWIPYWNLFDATGEIMHNVGGKNSTYAQAMLEKNGKKQFRGSALLYGEYRFNQYLKLRVNVSGSMNTVRNYYFKPSKLLNTTGHTEGYDMTQLDYNWLNENYLSYDRTIHDHTFSLMLGNSTQAWTSEVAQVRGQDYSTDYIWTLNNASVFKAGDNYSEQERHSLASFFFRGTYNWKSRYLFAGNIRYDGSSRFAKNNRWGFFPSASLGWRFSDESFMQWTKPFLDDAKLRLSYGVTGNEDIGNYASWPQYGNVGVYNGVGGLAPNLTYAELGWERTEQFNVGADFTMLGSRITLGFDWYEKNTSDLLYDVEVPKEIGYGSMTRNVGAMRNRGVEFSLHADLIRGKDWHWGVDFNISHNLSTVTKLADDVPFYTGNESAIYVQTGRPIGEFYGFRHDGVFAYDESNAYDDNWNQLTPVFNDGVFSHYMLNGARYEGNVNRKTRDGNVLGAGDVNWLDNPDDPNKGVIDEKDRVLLGCAQPDVFGGLNTTVSWKGLSLFLSFNYSLGGDLYNWTNYKRNNFANDMTTPDPYTIRNMWLYPGDDAIFPTPDKDHNWNRNCVSDYWIEDGSYIRLSSLKLSYQLPQKILEKIRMKSASIYFYGNNLLTWTNYSGFDPEFGGGILDFGIDTGKYPRTREFGFGINLGF